MNDSRVEALSVREQQSGPLWEQIQSHQLGEFKLRAIFNKVSATEQSQQIAINKLMEKVVVASACGEAILKYALFAVVQNLLADCQNEYFNEKDETHPFKTARLA